MKLLVYCLNTLNYITLLLLIILNHNHLQQIGLDICRYFLFSSILILITSLVIYFIKKNEVLLISVFINIFNIVIIFPMLLILLF
ncbi:hypothetical protein B5C09_07015 [Staphylococcus delphini]|nr:hypothetical protein B5C09_07015 [Staphylococcus delphini]PCF72405.1 hypothetical protein B4W71_08695 [Staphylococcus delphini]